MNIWDNPKEAREIRMLLHGDSKAAQENRAAERAKLGIGRNYKVIPAVPLEMQEGMAGDPQYYREVLGDTSNLDGFEL